MRLLIACFILVSSAALADTPQSGLWWNPAESGRGYAIDVQGNTLVLTMFAYDQDGRMQWYYSEGTLTNNGMRFTGTLLRLDNGQPLNGAYRPATIVGTAGEIAIDFASRTTGTLRLPAGGTTPIQRQEFGVGSPPQALLGTWLFAFRIAAENPVNGYADYFTFTRIAPATPTGNGVVTNAAGTIAAELKTSGDLAGQVVAFELNASGNIKNAYRFTQQLEEGRGVWIAPTTGNEYPAHVYRIVAPSGLAKSAAAVNEAPARDLEARAPMAAKAAAAEGVTIEALSARDPVLGAAIREMRDAARPTR